MREIKFRGLHIHIMSCNRHLDGLWVYGYLADKNYINSDKFGEMLVDPRTVGQYTGLKDKNGVEIYEGDIVHMHCDGLSGSGAIIHDRGCFWIDDKKRNRKYPLYNDAKYRVDGNVHENPELMEVGEQE